MRALCGLDGAIKGQVFHIPDQGLTIGKRRDNAVAIEDDYASRYHARIEVRPDGVYLVDLNSTNGTYVNEVQIATRRLHDGDVLRFGASSMKYVDEVAAVMLDDAGAARAGAEVAEVLASPGAEAAAAAAGEERLMGEAGTRVLAALSRMSEHPAATRDLDRTMGQVLDMVFDLVQVDRGCLILLDPVTGMPLPKAVRYRRGTPPKSHHDMPVSGTLARRAMTTRSAIYIPDARLDPLLAEQQSIVQHGIRCAAYVPLCGASDVLGLLCVDTGTPGTLTQTHLPALVAFANHAAIVAENSRLHETVQRESELRSSLVRYLSPSVVSDIMLRGADSAMRVELADVSVLFADIRGFTALAEHLPPKETVAFLNEVFARLTQVVFAYGGTLDKYLGDGMMALFGAPFPDDQHSLKAAVAALELAAELERAKPEWAEKYRHVQMGIGINTGEAVVGSVGSPTRMEYTAVGDVVNVAARLEDLAGPGHILASQEVVTRTGEKVLAEDAGEVTLRNRAQPVRVFRILGLTDQSLPRMLREDAADQQGGE